MTKINVEALFLSSLGSVDQLKWYLKENIQVINYVSSIWLDLTIAAIPKSNRREILIDFNTDKILGILKRQRPDLYNVLIYYPRGRRWLGEQIVEFRKYFLK